MNSATFTRRGALGAAACALCSAVVGRARSEPQPMSCDDLEIPPQIRLEPSERERDTIFLMLTMALVYDGWGVDRQNPDAGAKYAAFEPGRRFSDYMGYNIGALLVDDGGRIVSFALNRNVALNSSLEHAEARAVRNAFRIANAAAGPLGPKRWSFGALLSHDRNYSTLEPCAQCAGIIDLARIPAIIYGQDDPAQRHVAEVLYNLQRGPDAQGAPLPIPATFTPYWSRLAQAYESFHEEATRKGELSGATSFLATIEAYEVYRDAARDFAALTPKFPSNGEALSAARAFRARVAGRIADGVAPT